MESKRRLQNCFAAAIRSGWRTLAPAILMIITGGGVVKTELRAAEVPPPFIYGSAAIAPGQTNAYVTNRFITPASVVLLALDTTSWPDSPPPLPGLRILSTGTGFFFVNALDNSVAPVSGIPFNYIIFPSDAPTLGNATAGKAVIPGGISAVVVNLPAVLPASSIMLTATSGNNVGLKVHKHGTGVFTVATLDGKNAPATGIAFNYLVNNGAFPSGTGFIAAGAHSTNTSSSFVSNPAGVFVTIDTTAAPTLTVLPNIKIRSHAAGLFVTSTADLTSAPSTGVSFSWISVQPPAQFEEAGPTNISGNAWSVVADPTNYFIQYAGSMGGGIWKTTDGGDSWRQIGPNGGFGGFTRLLLNAGTLWALARNAQLYYSNNGGDSWSAISSPIPHIDDTRFPNGQHGFLAISRTGFPIVCSEAGVVILDSSNNWQSLGALSGSCTDVVATSTSTWVAIRNSGVWTDLNSTNFRKVFTNTASTPIRIAVGPSRVVLNIDCSVSYSDNVFTAIFPTWTNVGKVDCAGDSQKGYALSVAISPTNRDHFIIGAVEANLTYDGGKTWSGLRSDIGPDIHQMSFWDDFHLIGACDLGTRRSDDGGKSWRYADRTRRLTDGPPINEFYNIGVSLADQFGRVMAAGNAQDQGAEAIIGRNAGVRILGGESGLTLITPQPTNHTALDGTKTSAYRTYATSTSEKADRKALYINENTLLGPDFFTFETDNSNLPCFNSNPPSPNSNRPCQFEFSADVTAIAVSQAAVDQVLVSLSDGTLYRAVPGSNALNYECILCTPIFPGKIGSIYFTSNNVALLGYDNGVVVSLTSPFGTPVFTFCATPDNGKSVVGFASHYGDNTEVYVATQKRVFRSLDGGKSWTDITTGSLSLYLGGAQNVVGLARDDNNPYLYIALGQTFWGPTQGCGLFCFSNVLRTQTPAPGVNGWEDFGQGVRGLPITGIGISPNRALYVSTQGRGIWWRRDVAAVPPNSGINTPDDGQSHVGEKQSFTTDCSYPGTWHNIHTIDFKLAMGQGPGDGEPLALWVQFDQDRSVVRFYDPDTQTWLEGAPGSHRVLASRFAQLNLAETSFRGLGLQGDPTTVEITWSITFHSLARGSLQQYLRVADDFGASTNWDRVGDWRVTTGPMNK